MAGGLYGCLGECNFTLKRMRRINQVSLWFYEGSNEAIVFGTYSRQQGTLDLGRISRKKVQVYN